MDSGVTYWRVRSPVGDCEELDRREVTGHERDRSVPCWSTDSTQGTRGEKVDGVKYRRARLPEDQASTDTPGREVRRFVVGLGHFERAAEGARC